VAVVAGATRGAGRGIAVELGAAGATVYCTGRSSRAAGPSDIGRAETIEETAERVTAAGGVGIPARCDHADPAQVETLFARVATEQGGRLDILVNDIWGGEKLIEWAPFWELSLDKALTMLPRALFTHLITARFAAPLMVTRGSGLIVEITDGDTLDYRGAVPYDLAKTSVIRLARGMAEDLTRAGHHGITAVALTPGFLRSEEMLDHFGVSAENWRDATVKEPHFIASETPHFVGRAVVALAVDSKVHTKHGKPLSSWGLSREYGFTDLDGARPDWGRYFDEVVKPML
jgi:NAD(P)-dependent dehydrogenase (short-subunit alcohol dehydrogenase family)